MKKTIPRILFGTQLLVFGLNSFFNFIPLPEPSIEAGQFLGALASSGYIFPLMGIIEIIAGILLLTNKLTSLALVVIFPIILNALLYHMFLDIPGLAGALIATILNFILFFSYKEDYQKILTISSSKNN